MAAGACKSALMPLPQACQHSLTEHRYHFSLIYPFSLTSLLHEISAKHGDFYIGPELDREGQRVKFPIWK